MSGVSAECPVCGTPISQMRYAEIQDRIRKEEQAKLAIQAKQLRIQHEAALNAATQEAARKAKQELDQTLAKSQLNESKLAERIAQLEANEATLRDTSSRVQDQMRTQFAHDLKAATNQAATEARAAVTGELDAKDAEARILREAHAQELKQQRAVLDEHRDLELQKLRSEHVRQSEALQKKVQELNRKLEQKTAHELGEFPELDLHRALCEAFPGDNIRRVKKGEPGSDIIHEVMHKGQYCQTIIYDSKNRRLWQNIFVQKLLTDKANAKAEHAILVTAVFPNGHRDLCAVDGVILAKLTQVVTIAALLRDSIITDHLRNLSFKDRTEKKERLYNLITSEMFRQRMGAVERAVRDLEKIDSREAEEHRKVWTQRTVQYRTVDKSVRDLVTEVNVILQNPGSDAVSATPAATGTENPTPF